MMTMKGKRKDASPPTALPATLTLAEALEVTPNAARVITTAALPWRILHTNKAWSDLTGYRFTDVVGKTCRVLQGPATQETARKALRDAIEMRERVQTRLINYTFDGKPFECVIDCVPLMGGAHYCATITGVLITDGSVPILKGPSNP